MPRKRTSLPSIITLARAGSLELAERMFDESGFAERSADPGALAVHGRLLKDRAARLAPEGRTAAYAQAARAYAEADRIAPQPYTRLNVATLTYLAGDRAAACTLAGELVEWIDGADNLAETPYYLEATRAEALLLCGKRAACEAALDRAIAALPQAWSDHAATIRQLETIIAYQGEDAQFLDRFRPPRSLHFAGHLGVSPERHDELSATIRRVVAEERIGFAFGALAAGSEIVMAEALLAAGAELHVFLPGSPGDFAAVSVDPYGAEWRPRYERCLGAAVELRCFAQPAGGYQPLGSRFASDVGMGAAMMNAGQLASEAVQLLVCDDGEGPYGAGKETARSGRIWDRTGSRQRVLREARSAAVVASGAKPGIEGDPDLRLAAMIHIGFEGLDGLDEEEFARVVSAQLVPFRKGSAALSVQPDLVLPAGNARIAAFTDPADALEYAQGLLALPRGRLPLKLAGHYGLAHWLEEPAALVGRALSDLTRITAGAIAGVLTVSEPFARVLALAPGGAPHVEHVGEAGSLDLYAVTRT